jgi:two-component system sensor histidine kinase UhpB
MHPARSKRLSSLRLFNLRLPILARLLIANGAVVVLGAALGTTLTKFLVDASAFELAVAFTVGGVLISLLLNYLVLRVALRPLSSLTHTVDGIREGHIDARAPAPSAHDPDIDRLTDALNAMLGRLAAHTATIEANREQLRALSAQVITAQEEERKRIARELHDDTSQSLASLLIALERIDAAIPAEMADLKARLASASDLTRETLDGLRGLVADLRPLLLDDLGLVPAIRWYARHHLEREGIDVAFDAPAELPRLPAPVETALFRISQEAIHNIVRHADASQVRVSLACDGDGDSACADHILLRIEDDGVGFANAVSISPNGGGGQSEGRFGLFGVRERAAALGGDVQIASTPGLGTRLEVRLPI